MPSLITKIRSVVFAYFCILLISILSPRAFATGHLDLSQHDFNKQNIYSLDTQWLIAWDGLYSPTNIPEFAVPYDFPQTWQNLQRNDGNISPYGSATLYLAVTLPKYLPGIYLKLPDLPSAGTLWANGHKIIDQGLPSLQKDTEISGFGPDTVYIHSQHSHEHSTALDKNQILLALQLSNHHYKEGGTWHSILIAGDSGFHQLTTLPAVTDSALSLLLFVLGGLFLSLYLARKKEISALFFSLFCLLVGLRNSITGEHILNQLVPQLSWHVSQSLEYLCLFISLPLFIAFTHRLYPQYKSPLAEKVFTVIATLFSLIAVFTPTTVFTQTSVPFQVIIVIAICYLFRIAVLAVKHKRKSGLIYLMSFIILTLTVVIDLLTHNMIIQLPLLSEWGVSIFVVMQAWLLNQRYAFSLNNEESLSERLKKQNKELQALDSMKDDFLAQTSHELRTPIHGISSLSELIIKQENTLSKESSTNLQLIHSSANRLANLVNDILDLSSIKHQSLRLNLSAVTLLPVIEQVSLSLRPLLKGRPVTFRIQCPEWIPKVFADENRLQQVLFNLIGNAIKFTPEGEIDVVVEMASKERVKISIKDTGLGIDHSETSEIFEAYKQGQQGLSASGHGLGLTITRDLLRMHKSDLQVQSVPGHGSTFYFHLEAATHLPGAVKVITDASLQPIKRDSNAPERRQHQRNTTHINNSGEHPLIIWAVDDEPVNLQVIETQLNFYGYQSRCFNSGQLMLQALESEEQPDVLLLDVMMPGLNGLEVCQRVRETYSAVELPIIMLTARQQPNDIINAFEAGASDYLAKPYNQAEFNARLQAQLQTTLCHELTQNNDELIAQINLKEQLEQELNYRNQLLLKAFDTSSTAFAVLDHYLTVEYQNLAMGKLLVNHPDYFQGKCLQPINALIEHNQALLQASSQWQDTIIAISSKITIHRFTHQGHDNYCIVIEPLNDQSNTTDIENRMQLLEDIVAKLGSQHIAEIDNSAVSPSASSVTSEPSDVIRKQQENKAPPQTDVANPEIEAEQQARHHLVDATRLALRLWEKHTGKNKTALAEESKIWRVYIDGGTVKTRTLDKYLNEKTLPKRPRWRSVIKTLHYVIEQANLDTEDTVKLEQLSVLIEQDQLSK